MDEKTTRMVFATAALAAVAAVLAGPGGAQIPEGNGVQPVAAQSDGWQAQSSGNPVVPYLSQGSGVDKAQFSGTAQSLGLTGDSPLTRVSAPEPDVLTGDTALTRVPDNEPAPTVSSGDDSDWTFIGAGAGMVALVAAGLAGVLLAMRRRHAIGLP